MNRAGSGLDNACTASVGRGAEIQPSVGSLHRKRRDREFLDTGSARVEYCVIPVTSHIGHFSHKQWWPKKSAEPDKGFPWTRQRFADRKLVA